MRHLIDTYIEADAPRPISPFDDMPLLELIVKTGIASAINSRLDALNGNKDAIAESIENNVRSKIIKEGALELAMKIDETVKQARPDGWRGIQAKENVIKAALYGMLQSVDKVERIFLIIRQQKEY